MTFEIHKYCEKCRVFMNIFTKVGSGLTFNFGGSATLSNNKILPIMKYIFFKTREKFE